MSASRTSAVFVALTLLTAVIGGWAGVNYGLHQARSPQQLDQLLHTGLHLSAAQDEKLAALEADFASKRAIFDAEMRLANRDIASAITVRHRYDGEAQAAIDRLHRAMIGLQQASVQHVIAMRALLSGNQVEQFDRTVDQALGVTGP